MLQKKLFSTNQNQSQLADYTEMECPEHNLPRKYYAANINKFYCEHDQPESETVHFRLILDKYREDIKNIKNLSSNLTENIQIKEVYNNTIVLLQKIFEMQENLGKQINSFNTSTFQRIYSLISHEQEIFRLKDLIESIKFLPDGRADYIGIGADAIREKNYLNLAKILIERNIFAINSDQDQNNLTFQILKFLEQLQNFIVLFVDEAYVFIKFVFDNLLGEVAKLENNKIEVNYINNFALCFVHVDELNKLKEKFNLQQAELSQLKIEFAQLEKENLSLKEEALQQNVLRQKIKDDKNTIDSLKQKIQELNAELNNLKITNTKVNLELETANQRISEYSLTIKNSSLSIESLKIQFEENLNKLKNCEKSFNLELEKNKIYESENSILKIKIETYEKMIKQFQIDLQTQNNEIQMLRENHDSELSMASGQLDNLQKITSDYESVLDKLEKDLLDEKKKFSELKINSELKLNEANKKYASLEIDFNNSSVAASNEIGKLKAMIAELENELNEANKKNGNLINEMNTTNQTLKDQISLMELKIKELNESNAAYQNQIKHSEQTIIEYQTNYISNIELSKMEMKQNELNSLIFDLKCLNTALNKRITELEWALAEQEKKAKIAVLEKDALSIQYRDLLTQYNSIINDSSKKRTDEDRRIIDISIRLTELTKLYEADQRKIREFDNVLKQEREKYQQTIFILEKQVKDLNLIMEEYYKTKDYSENELIDERKKTNFLINENKSLLEKNKVLLFEYDQLKNDINESNSLRTQIEEFRIQLHSQLKQNEILLIRLEDVERELRNERLKYNNNSNTPKNIKMTTEFKNQFDSVFIQKEKLEKELIEKKAKLNQLQMHNDSLVAKFELANMELNSLKEQKNSFPNFQAQIKNYISQIEEANKNKANVELENSELRNKLNKAALEIEQFKLGKESNAVLISKLKEEINELRKSEKKIELLSNSKLEIEKLKSKLEKSESEKFGLTTTKKFMSSSITMVNNINNNANVNSINKSSSCSNNVNLIKSQHDMQEYLTLQKTSSTSAINDFVDAKDLVSSAPSAKTQSESVSALSNYNSNSNFNIDFGKNNATNLLLNAKHFGLIKEWFTQLKIGGSAKITLNLLMKASRDGFNWETFRDRCHNKSPTLVIVKTSFEKLIGGYTPLPWNQSNDQFQYVKDDSKKSFLFSLTNEKKYNIKNHHFAICNGNQIGPIFGGGSDLEIVHNCNVNFNNFSAIGHTYDYNETPEAFYGGLFYTVKDYEIYEVKY